MNDLVANAIISAVSAGAVSGAGETTKKAVADSYDGLKSLLKRKFGQKSVAAAAAVSELESKPDSSGRRQIVSEELAAIGAGSDTELATAAASLVSLIKALPQGEKHLQYAQGTGIAQADRGSAASVTMTALPKKDA